MPMKQGLSYHTHSAEEKTGEMACLGLHCQSVTELEFKLRLFDSKTRALSELPWWSSG